MRTFYDSYISIYDTFSTKKNVSKSNYNYILKELIYLASYKYNNIDKLKTLSWRGRKEDIFYIINLKEYGEEYTCYVKIWRSGLGKDDGYPVRLSKNMIDLKGYVSICYDIKQLVSDNLKHETHIKSI